MTAPIASIDGLWWPVADTDARYVILRDRDPDISRLLPHIPGRACIVQAGANVGVYALELAKHFASVVTAEPDPTNYECLKRNLAEHGGDRITALHAAFGEREGGCETVVVKPNNCGAHRVTFEHGQTPVWTIDGLELTACDAIWLDVEGSELLALKGAAATIERFSPIISCEDKGLNGHFGIPGGALQAWLAERGYVEIDRIGRDKIFRRQT